MASAHARAASFLVREACATAAVALLATLAIFCILQQMPGGPLSHLTSGLGSGEGPEDAKRLLDAYGYGEAPWMQFVLWWGGVLRGDFGLSPHYPGRDAIRTLVVRASIRSFLLAISASLLTLLLAVVTAIPLGKTWPPWSAVVAAKIAKMAGAIPAFLLCLLFYYAFLVSGREPVLATAMNRGYPIPLTAIAALVPVLLLALSDGFLSETIDGLARDVRDLRRRDFIAAARSRGESIGGPLLHAAALPLLGVLAGRAGFLVGGIVVVEQVFDIYGLGYLSWVAASQKDYFLILALTLALALLVRVIRMGALLGCHLIDPRLGARTGRAGPR